MNKRFEIKKDGFDKYVVSDKLNQFPMPIISLQGCECIEKAVNGLWEQTQRFEKHNQELIQRNIKYEDKIDELKNENKQLKKQLSSINQLIDNKIDEFKNGDYGDLPCNTIHMFLDLKQEIGDVE